MTVPNYPFSVKQMPETERYNLLVSEITITNKNGGFSFSQNKNLGMFHIPRKCLLQNVDI
jgi:hypothetical protein